MEGKDFAKKLVKNLVKGTLPTSISAILEAIE
ncbi:hypothetical protein DESME_02980 [Desulfitobacterium metallireducens DSM 15288]|uniref:Uncharacterized protein n=1 Tax=Desulfitobacterium metallireducens DSM 15288 TaxID=871968 RepID=W0EFZ4_9FIRM|nr:hypothetical protein DESME_02980 [Desulfitobacterium metallireducens DSM 15288]